MDIGVENIETILRYFVIIIAITVSLVGSILAFIKGRKNRELTKALTEAEQRDDLWDYMVDEIENAESTAILLITENKSEWKKNTVLKNVTLYAKGQGYSWFNKEEWSKSIDDYVKGTKNVNFTESSGN